MEGEKSREECTEECTSSVSIGVNSNESSENSDIVEEKRSETKLAKRNRNSKFKFMKNSSGLVSLYITSCERDLSPKVTLNQLKAAFPNLEPASSVDTNYGLIINLANDKDVRKILKLDLAKIFGKPVQVVPLFSGQFKRIITFRDVPWCIRNEELEICLKNQGIHFGKLTREKSVIYVEVSDFPNFQRLREEGINFYDSVVFRAAEDTGLNDDITYNSDNIIQCYRCQGFWHTANTCKQNIRCVRCGEEHSVENCNRPKHNPICCNCKGPHHAAYKLCPVRIKLKKSVRVSFSFNQ